MNRTELYFIALIPHDELRRGVRAIKERIRDEYGAGHALKSPAHITMQMPFKRSPADEERVSAALRRFASAEKCFRVDLDGYGAFSPRVIYIKITRPQPIEELHGRLRELLLDSLGFSPQEVMQEVQPHITVATRDLTKVAYNNAWPEMRKEEFSGSFTVRSIFLLKHNGRNWDIKEEYPFGEQ